MTGKTGEDGTKKVKIMVLLKCLSNFWRTLEMSLINCNINLDLNWSKNWIIAVTDVVDQVITFTITETKLYVSVLTLLTQDNTNCLSN